MIVGQRVPVIGRRDNHGVDVLALEDAAEIARGEGGLLIEVLLDALRGLRHLLVVHVAQRDALSAEAQRGAQVGRSLAAAANQRDAHAPVGAGDTILRRGLERAGRAGAEQDATRGARGGVPDKRATAATFHISPPENGVRSLHPSRAGARMLHQRRSSRN